MNLEVIKKLLEEHRDSVGVFKRNVIKEYLQILTLSFIYSNRKYQQFIFYGGSCLKHCFGLERLSEDLDFIDSTKNIDLRVLADDLELFFVGKIGIKPKAKIQKFRIYLKFPILFKLNLASRPESDFLNIKIEIFKDFNFCKDYKIEVIPIFKFGESFLARTLDLPSLMATKIRAILFRKWEKTDRTGKTLVKIKGRDYFDLMWYLEKKIKPNLKCICGTMNMIELKERLLKIVKTIDKRSIVFDLEGLIEDKNFIKDLSRNIKEILIREIKNKL